MTTERLNEYFAGEAEEYLEEMVTLLSAPDRPGGEAFIRLAAGVRGATAMAGADAVSRLAGRLEEAARSLDADRLAWNETVQRLALSTVDEIRALIARLGQWGPEEEQRVDTTLWKWVDALGSDWLDSRPVVPIDTLFYDDAGPHIFAPSDVGDAVLTSVVSEVADEVERAVAETANGMEGLPVVPIESLLLRGEPALLEALALRSAIDAQLRGGHDSASLDGLLSELFELIELGLHTETAEA